MYLTENDNVKHICKFMIFKIQLELNGNKTGQAECKEVRKNHQQLEVVSVNHITLLIIYLFQLITTEYIKFEEFPVLFHMKKRRFEVFA